jgi:hypothetical protein
VWVNALLLGVFDELTATGSAFVVLLAVMDSTIFDGLLGAITHSARTELIRTDSFGAYRSPMDHP